MDVPEKFVEKAKEIISSWVMGKIPSYDGKIEQIAKALYQADQEARGRK